MDEILAKMAQLLVPAVYTHYPSLTSLPDMLTHRMEVNPFADLW